MSGIPVVIAANGRGTPVRPVELNAPLMTVAGNGLGAPIVISNSGAPFVVEGLWFDDGDSGYWPAGYDPRPGRLYQDASGTIPALDAGEPIGRVARAAGTADATQATALSRPTLARWPKGGRRNMLLQTDRLDLSPWTRQPGVSADLVAEGWWEVTFPGESQIYQIISPSVPNDTRYTLSVLLRAGSLSAADIILSRTGNGAQDDSDAWIISGPGTIANRTGGRVSVAGLSPTTPTRLAISRTTRATDPGTSLAANVFGMGAGNFFLTHPQVVQGPDPTPYQSVASANDVTEEGVPDVWHLFDDGGDSLNVTLPADTYGLAWVDHLGAVTVTTVVSDGSTPIDTLRVTRQADVILRSGAFSPEEESSLRAYWARYSA